MAVKPVIRRVDLIRLRRALKSEGFKLVAKDEDVTFQEIPVTIDRPKGFVQDGTDPAGKPWRRVYRYDYGFIPKTEGGDLEDVDVFLGPAAAAPTSFWAVQTKDDGSFDEFKIFLGFSSLTLARSCYRMHIPAKFCAGFFRVPVAALKSMLGLAPQPLLQGLEKTMRNRTIKLAGVSFDTVQSSLSSALALAYPPDTAEGACSPSCGPYPIEVYDDAVIFNHDGKTWKQPYTFADGVATLGGAPLAVVRTYVPVSDAGAAPGAGEVTMSQKNSVKKAGTASGAGDIVSLASERLAVCAQTLSKGDGTITPEIAAEISAVMALLEVAGSLYTGSTENAPELADPEGDDTDDGGGGGDLTMADVADAEKRGGTVKMTATQLIAYASQRLAKVRKEAEANPTAAAVKSAQIEAMLLNGLASLRKATGDDDKIDVVVPADEEASTVETPKEVGGIPNPAPQAAPPAPAPEAPPALGAPAAAPATADKAVAKAAASVASLRARIGGTPAAPVTKNEAPPGETAPPSGAELFTAEYIDALPDSSFLHVDEGAQVDKAGRSQKTARHFPVRDANGIASVPMIDRAIAALPTWGATAKTKEMAQARASSLKIFAVDLQKSREQAATRKDDAEWPGDLATPNDRMQPDLATQNYGFDNLAGKLEGAPAK